MPFRWLPAMHVVQIGLLLRQQAMPGRWSVDERASVEDESGSHAKAL